MVPLFGGGAVPPFFGVDEGRQREAFFLLFGEGSRQSVGPVALHGASKRVVFAVHKQVRDNVVVPNWFPQLLQLHLLPPGGAALHGRLLPQDLLPGYRAPVRPLLRVADTQEEEYVLPEQLSLHRRTAPEKTEK